MLAVIDSRIARLESGNW